MLFEQRREIEREREERWGVGGGSGHLWQMTDTVFDGVQTQLTHNLSFFLLSLSSHSVPLRLSLYLHLHHTLACRGSSQPPPHIHMALLFYISSFRLLWPLCPCADSSPRRMMGPSPAYRHYLLSASIRITFL